ncbi:hypothetical protein Tsubulata_009356, partial [Turnera subulata]
MSAIGFTPPIHAPIATKPKLKPKPKSKIKPFSSLTTSNPIAQPSFSDPFVLQLAETLEDSLPPSPPLQKLRDSSSESLLSTPWPTRKEEAFRFTDTSFIKNSQILPVTGPPPRLEELPGGVSEDTQLASVVIADGFVLNSASGLPDGVFVGSLLSDSEGRISKRVSELVGDFEWGDLFWSVNGLGAPDVGVVYVPKGVRVENPIYLRYVSVEGVEGGDEKLPVSNPRMVVVVEEEGEVGIIEEFVSREGSNDKCYWANPVLEVVVGEGAKFRHSYLQSQSFNSAHIKWTSIKQEAASSYELVEVSTGGKLSRHNLHIQQLGPDTATELSTFHLTVGDQTQDLHSRLVLDHPRAYSRQIHKCIVAHSQGQAVFDGNVKVNRYAQQTDAGQLTRTLLLEPRATVNVKPNLQIIADDVKCSHGAAISDLEESQHAVSTWRRLEKLSCSPLEPRLSNDCLILFSESKLRVMSKKGETVGISPDRDGNSLRAYLFSTTIDVHLPIPPHSDFNRPVFFSTSAVIRQNPTRTRLSITCNSSSKPTLDVPPESPVQRKNPSLYEQLKPLSATTLPNNTSDHKAQLLSKPKSTWVNPTRPKKFVLSLQRQKKSPYSYNPLKGEVRVFAQKLYECDTSESAFTSVLEQAPEEVSRGDALFILKSFKEWQKARLFLNWIKTQDWFPIETIFYNVTMKSLRFGNQFELVEELAHEMVSTEIQLDNITYSTIITCAKRCSKFDKAVEWFERMYKTGLMPDEVTYSAVLNVYAKLGKVQEVLNLYERGTASGWKPDPITFCILAKMFGEAGDFDGIRYVMKEMKSAGVQPNLAVYNTLLEAMGKAARPGLARNLFEELVESGVTPSIYGRARWDKDATDLLERIKSHDWTVDAMLYNTLLGVCADFGLVDDAERPDSWSYAAMLNIYGSTGDAAKGMELFEEMSKRNEDLPELFSARTSTGTHKLSQGLGNAFASHVEELAAPLKQSEEIAGCFVATREELVNCVRSRL